MKLLKPSTSTKLAFAALLFSMASEDANADLLGYWNFDGDSYADSSGLGNAAQAGPGTQAPIFSTDVAVPFAGRVNSRSLDMRNRTVPTTGTNCYAVVPTSSSLYNSAGSFTVSVWVKGWPTDSWVPFVSKNGEGNGWQVRRNGGGNELDWTTRGTGTGFTQGNGDFSTGSVIAGAGPTSPGARPTQWYHYVCTFDGTNKRIYLNSQLVSQQANPGATIQSSANLLVFGARDNGGINSFSRVMIDEVAIWNNALSDVQITDLFSGTDPRFLHSQVTPWNLGEPWGTTGNWGVKEAKTMTPGWQISNLNTALGVAASVAGVTGSSPTIFFKDPDNAGGGGGAPSNYFSNAAGDDEDFVQIATCCFRVTTPGDYTFAFNGDDGFQASLFGVNWTKINTSNGNAVFSAETLTNMVPTGDTNTYAVANLPAGDYNFRYVWYERGGGAWNRVRIASGDKTGDDGSFKNLGDPTGVVTLVDQAPMMLGFTSNAYSVLTTPTQTPATLTFAWDTKYASSISISPTLPGNPTLTPGTNSVTFPSPTSTTTYTLTGTNGTQSRTSTLTVFVDQQPTISSFTASDNTVVAGAPITLNWSTIGATSVSIDQGIGAVSPANGGSLSINAPASTTTYTISATNSFGTVTAQMTVTIGLPPVIDSLTTPDNALLPGGLAQIDWQTSLADSVTLAPRPGAVAVDGQHCENPTSSTTYTLTATNAFASVSQALSVSVAAPLTVTSAGWNQVRLSSPVTVNSLSICDQLFAGTIVPSGTFTQSGLASINQGDGAVGVFVGGEGFPPGGNGDNFVVKSTATLRVFFSGYYTFGINNDDGGRLRIDGQDVIVDDTNHGPTSFLSSPKFLTAGDHAIEYLYFEQGGGFAGEVFTVRGDGVAQLLATNMATPPVIGGSDLRITEFCAENTQLLDSQADSPDWVEIYNPTASAINLAGYYLTNSALGADQAKWAFPSFSLPAGSYLVVFASAKNTTLGVNEFHTNFTLPKIGGYLGLNKDSGTPGVYTLVDSYAYPAQFEDKSYGRYDTENTLGFFDVPSPGSINPAGIDGFVGDTSFSVDRGIKSAPFTLTITTNEPSAQIRYTLDGSAPTEATGLIYTAPLNISSTTIVRAAGFKKRWKPTNVDTHSYFFHDDILLQSAASTLADGWPLGPVAGQRLDYGMDSRVVTGNQTVLKTALSAIPTVSIVTALDNLLHPTTGIYVDANQRGENWERPASIEYINDTYAGVVDGSGAFQIDAGLRIRGGYSRSDNNPKHAFRLFFSNQYDGDLRYALFGKDGTNRFENIDLQTSQNYSWSFDPGTNPGNAVQNYTFLREVVSRDNQRDMGNPHTRSRYVHLYINGKYWGLYMTQERAESNYGQNYLGGNEDNYDVIKSAGNGGGYNTEATDGTMAQGTSVAPGSTWARFWWRAKELREDVTSEASRTARYFAMQGLQSDGVTPDAGNPKVLNPENLADYMLNSFQTGSFDAPLSTFLGGGGSNNWFGMKDRTANSGFVFFSHDHEHGMGTDGDGRSDNRVGPWAGNGTNAFGQAMHNNLTNYARSNPAYLHENLAFSAEYRMKFADRVHKLFFNNGPLSDASVVSRINARAAIMDGVVIAESARWGDANAGGGFFQKSDWLTAKNRLISWVNTGTIATFNAGTGPGRAATVVAQLRAYKDNVAGTLAGPSDPSLVSMPLYPLTDGPVFAQFGGIVPQNFSLTITDPNGTNPNTSGDSRTIYYRLDEQDPREIGGGIRAGSLSGSPATLTVSGLVKARIFNSTKNEWSALTEALFVVGAPASSANLVISEINYQPKGPFLAPATSKEDYEFIELWNPSTSQVQLDGVQFTTGVEFNFTTQSSISSIAPGERIVLVKNLAAFQQRYPDSSYPGLSAKIAGVFVNTLDNGGEQLVLRNTIAGADIANFSYDDDGVSWPKGPDGNGATLCFTAVDSTTADKSLGSNWFAHGLLHGNPGGPDSAAFATWASGFTVPPSTTDSDGDGVNNLLEYALGSLPANSGSYALPTGGTTQLDLGDGLKTYLTLTFTRPTNTSDLLYRVQTSQNLTVWNPDAVMMTRTDNGNGTETYLFRSPLPLSGPDKQFIRLSVELLD
jgi:hypothetical protein